MNEIAQFAPGLDRISEGSLYPHQADGVAFLLSKKRDRWACSVDGGLVSWKGGPMKVS